MSAYFDFFTGQEQGFKVARRIVQKYEEYPILAWRMPFLDILDQLNEYDGEVDIEEEDKSEGIEGMSEEKRKQKYKKQIKKEPMVTFEISEKEQGVIEVEVANVKSITVKFYIIDAEILFSRTPFIKSNSDEFSYVKPC